MSARANAETPAAAALIVFGRDTGGKPHASRFDASEAELVEKAAGLMGMQVLGPGEQRALAAKLPKGRVFASGRAFVPFVKAAVYGPLAAFGRPAGGEGAGDPESGCTVGPGDAAGHTQSGEPGDPANPNGGHGNGDPPAPGTWADIDAGSLVLATTGPGEPWYESVVVKAAGDVLTLKWRDYPDDPQFVRRRHKVALLHPTGKAA